MKLTTEQITRYLLDIDKDKAIMNKIIKDDEASRVEFEKYLEVWEKSANLTDYQGIDTQEDWMKVKKRMGLNTRSKTIPMRTYFLRIAAILIFALSLTVFFTRVLQTTSDRDMQYFELAAGNAVRSLEMPDGSVITLCHDSKIIHNSEFGDSNRDIILEGQAFFEVSHNEKLPFKVHTLNSVVEVLGTKFNIDADSNLVTVGVLSGKVALYENENTDNRVELNTLNTGVFHRNEKNIDFHDSFDHNSLTWKTQKFVFRNEPLRDVCVTLANHYQLELATDEDVEFLDSINFTCSSKSIDQVVNMINSFVVEDVELVNTEKQLIVRKQ